MAGAQQAPQQRVLLDYLAVVLGIAGGRYLRRELGDVVLAASLLDLQLPPTLMLVLILVLIFLLGWPFEWPAIILVFLPIFFPVVTALGYDPIWFGIILVKLNGIATLSPPVGLVVFVVNGVRPDISVADIFRGIWPFIFADIITIGCLTAWPEIVTFILDAAS